MTNFSLNVTLDYAQKKINAALVAPGTVTGLAEGATFRLIDSNGTAISSFLLSYNSGLPSFTSYRGSSEMGLDMSSIYRGGYESAFTITDLSGVYISDPTTNWEMSNEFAFIQSQIAAAEVATVLTPAHIADFRSNIYLDTPLVIKRGDSVMQAAIATVTDKNKITLTVDKVAASYTGYNFDNCFMQVISGAASGQIASITSQSGPTLTVDRDCYSLSGQLVKLMPYRIITSYSGLAYKGVYSGLNRGSRGLSARFGLNETVPCKVGSLYYTSGFYSGLTFADHPLLPGVVQALGGTTGYTAGVVALATDTYKRDVRYGDVLLYNPASSPSSINTGLILEVGTHAVSGQGSYHIKYWPGIPASTGSTYTISRNNEITLESFPVFGQEYIGMATSIYGQTGTWTTTVSAPTASVGFTANEQESTYANITETSHFLVGPLTTSNGQVINDTVTGNQTPSLMLTGYVLHGNPVSPTTLVNVSAFSTQNPNIGDRYNGMFYQNGILTFAGSAAFTTAQIVTCNYGIRFGTNRINNTIAIPVQPAI